MRGVLVCLLSAGVASAAAEVRATEEKIVMPTWEIGPPQVHPLFPDVRRGDIYPYTLNEILTNNRVEKTYHAVVLENEYIKVVVLPEIGGRLHGALDKTNNYVWIYWQKTIKPGLISMSGAWISGGIEWNFPHGHRPSCFMPVDHRLVRNPDGSATVWVGETEPVFRMRWLVGMTVYPGKSYVRCDYIFTNPTSVPHSFMFWATAATHANEYTQAQYPGDMVTGHGKHEFWNWPIHNGVDLTWWKNVPNASSFFAFNNPSEWFGTYDHKARGGTVHFANVHTMPGKKLWTWGSGPSGRIWEDILTEGGGPYFEPQAGAWSDNQPDYHWLGPHEVKTTHDYWYPVRDIRGFHNANRDFAVNTDYRDGKAFGGVYATGAATGCRVVLKNTKTGAVLSDAVVDIAPDKPYTVEVAAPGAEVYDLHLAVFEPGGRLAIEVRQRPPQKVELPEGQKDPGDPKTLNLDGLYHAGEWLDRFRRTDEALIYYREALARDPGDSRVNAALGYLALKQARWKEALGHFDAALKRDSDNSRLYYGKALALLGLGNQEEAYRQFYRATYGYESFAPAYVHLARIDLARGDYAAAVDKLKEAEAHNRRFADIPALKAAALRRLGRHEAALAAADRALELDPMHPMGGYERLLALARLRRDQTAWSRTWQTYMRQDVQNYLELAFGYLAAGLRDEADELVAGYSRGRAEERLHPMVSYLRGYLKELDGDRAAAARFYAAARRGPVAYANPHRLEEIAVLEAALRQEGRDAHAHLFLGNLLYAKGRREEGLAHWRRAVEADPRLVFAWRNVGYAERHFKCNLAAALAAYERAAALDPGDARILLELDQVAQAAGQSSAERLARLERNLGVVRKRDDLLTQLIDLRLERSTVEDLEFAHEILRTHHFHVWEGGYGIHHAWVEVNQKLGDAAFARRDHQAALRYYEQATLYPKNLQVAPRTPDFRAHVYWNLARVYQAMGDAAKAAEYLKRITAERYRKPHLGTYYQALAYKSLGRTEEYRRLLETLEKEARERTSGRFEYRGRAETIGHYLLALVLGEKGETAAAEQQLREALRRDPQAPRLAITEAQIDTAGAHQ